MKVYIKGHHFKYETEKLIRIFQPFERVDFIEDENEAGVCLTLEIKGDKAKMRVALSLEGKVEQRESSEPLNSDKEYERMLAVLLYECFESVFGYSSRWGILTGVRPAKLYNKLSNELGEAKAKDYFSKKLLVSDGKIDLCKSAVEGERAIIDLSEKKSFSLYIGIPFCPSRCSYCSFVSHSVEYAKKLIPEYVKLLCEEIRITGEIAQKCNLKLETVYFGGGTPTTLSPEQLAEVMSAVGESFDLNGIREYTVEAGRPDTITKEKLEAIKLGGADRISINPQTMNDAVLEKIGRKHSAEQTREAMRIAKSVGFRNINMDLIAGLPGDNLESFKNTVNEVLGLNPESITIHTLCLKKAANMTVSGQIEQLKFGEETSKMLDFGKETLEKNGFYPYYMYRQSKMVGNLENVGYSKKGFEGLYNVYIMDETHTILACGASAVTKLRAYNENRIERIYNFKYPYEYISRFSVQIARKEKILEFYDNRNS